MTSFIIAFGLAAAAAVLSVDATTVAVLEFGKGGVARRTTAASSLTSAAGVASFLSSMHEIDSSSQRRRRTTQHPGMTIVPDLFNKADGGIVLGVIGSAVDLASMPNLARVIEGSAIGHFTIEGNKGEDVMNRVSKVDALDSARFSSSVEKTVKSALSKDGNRLEALTVRVDADGDAADVDTHIAAMLKSLQELSDEVGSTVVVHLVIDEEDGASRRSLMSRKLEDNENGEDNKEEDNKDEADNEAEDNNQDADYSSSSSTYSYNSGSSSSSSSSSNANGFYGYGYFNSNNEWITPYRTMFQIQYFNVVLWSSVGLAVILFVSIGMMMYMPLLPDTLLFGESAKMMGD